MGDAPTLLPRPAYRSSREAAAASQRARMLVAMAEESAARGYAAVAVADVIARAGVSRRSFYEHFDDKQDCFLAAYDEGVRTMAAQVGQAIAEAEDWRGRVRVMIARFLEMLASEPVFARLALVEIWAVGPAGVERVMRTDADSLALLIVLQRGAREEEPGLPEVAPVALEAALGGVDRVATTRVAAGRVGDLPELAAELGDFVVDAVEGAA